MFVLAYKYIKINITKICLSIFVGKKYTNKKIPFHGQIRMNEIIFIEKYVQIICEVMLRCDANNFFLRYYAIFTILKLLYEILLFIIPFKFSNNINKYISRRPFNAQTIQYFILVKSFNNSQK